MKKNLYIAFFAMCSMLAKAQNIYYNGAINHQNFRTEASFLQEIEQGNIDYERANACLFHATNEQRAKHNRPIAKSMDAMESAAWYHAKSMTEQDYFSHQNPNDPSRKNVSDRLKLVGLGGTLGAENIAAGNAGGKTYLQMADMLIEMWMNSPGHRAGMLQDKEVYLGAGVFLSPKDFKCKAAQVFADGHPKVNPNEVLDNYSNIRIAGKYDVKTVDEQFIFDNGSAMKKVDILGNIFWQELNKNNRPIGAFTELRRTATHVFLKKSGDKMFARLALGVGGFEIAYSENPSETEWKSLAGSRYVNSSDSDINSDPKKTEDDSDEDE